jgi:hypothetical protein
MTYISVRLFLGISLLSMIAGTLCAQTSLPQYCKTEAGVLGPYTNPGNVKVGDPCYGTKNGQTYSGVAVMSKGGGDENDNVVPGGSNQGRRQPGGNNDDLPHYCKTEAGVLGPYPNPGNVHAGDPCYGIKDGQTYYGVAVVNRGDN